MNWQRLRTFPWLDTRSAFLAKTPSGGRHLDAGCSTGAMLSHFQEMRPDLKFAAVDYQDYSGLVGPNVDFVRADLVNDTLPFSDASFDSITMMHVLEHMPEPGNAPREFARLLKPGGRLYIEGPGPRSVLFPSANDFTLNFYDDPTHLSPLSTGRIARVFGVNGLRLTRVGFSRSWLLIAAMPLSLLRGDRQHFFSALISAGGWTVRGEFIKEIQE